MNVYFYHHCQRYGIDCAHVLHIGSQAKEFEEPNHHCIGTRWWNTYYLVACLSSSSKKFDALGKAVKMLILNEKRRFSCEM